MNSMIHTVDHDLDLAVLFMNYLQGAKACARMSNGAGITDEYRSYLIERASFWDGAADEVAHLRGARSR